MTAPFVPQSNTEDVAFCFRRLGEDIDLLDDVLTSLEAFPGGIDLRLLARLEVTARAVIQQFNRLRRRDPDQEGGPLVQ